MFQPIGGGVHEAIHLSAKSSSTAASDPILDEAYASTLWMRIWREASGLVDDVLSDNFEQCGPLHRRKNKLADPLGSILESDSQIPIPE